MRATRPSGYPQLEEHVLACCEKWQLLLSLSDWDVRCSFHDGNHADDDEGPATVAECKPLWQHLRADIEWYLPTVATLADDQIDQRALHEMVHVLLSAEQANMKPSEADRMELSTEMVTRALWKAWHR
jgi:hypothetical protein